MQSALRLTVKFLEHSLLIVLCVLLLVVLCVLLLFVLCVLLLFVLCVLLLVVLCVLLSSYVYLLYYVCIVDSFKLYCVYCC